jgi:hypothetical protein
MPATLPVAIVFCPECTELRLVKRKKYERAPVCPECKTKIADPVPRFASHKAARKALLACTKRECGDQGAGSDTAPCSLRSTDEASPALHAASNSKKPASKFFGPQSAVEIAAADARKELRRTRKPHAVCEDDEDEEDSENVIPVDDVEDIGELDIGRDEPGSLFDH